MAQKKFSDLATITSVQLANDDQICVSDTSAGLSKKISISEFDARFGDLNASNNLSDITTPATARANLGLGNVDNTADASKPVSTAQATAINARLAAASNLSDVADAPTSRTNLGLGSVDNTTDLAKPISTLARQGNLRGMRGSASGGSAPINSTTALTEGKTYYYDNLTIGASGVVNTSGAVIRVKGTLSIAAGGVLKSTATAGTAASGATAGVNGNNSAYLTPLYQKFTGGTPATGVTGVGAQATTLAGGLAWTCVLNAGAAGGAGGAGTSGAGGTAQTALSVTNGFVEAVMEAGFRAIHPFGGPVYAGIPGQSGGSGAGDGSNTGGGGGGGGGAGGIVYIICDILDNQGTISADGANGGAGGNSSAGNTGGGGGGGGGQGGMVYIIARTVTNLGTITVNGGTGGALGTKTGTGVNGTAGSNGNTGKRLIYDQTADTWTT